jgi:hypothetical protein
MYPIQFPLPPNNSPHGDIVLVDLASKRARGLPASGKAKARPRPLVPAVVPEKTKSLRDRDPHPSSALPLPSS